jgi:hypothetical protein
MKKLIIIIALFNTAALSAQQSFAPVGATWYFLNTNTDCFTYTTEKDTVINGKTCSVTGNSFNNKKEYLHTENNKVYYWFNGEFYIMFDFTVQAGDSIELGVKSITQNFEDTVIMIAFKVIETSYRMYGGQNIKSIVIEQSDYNVSSYPYINNRYVYSEKFGCLSDYKFLLQEVLNTTLNLLGFLAYKDADFTYVEQQQVQIYGTDMLCDYPNKATRIEEQKNEQLAIYPNPVKDEFQITLNSDLNSSVYNLFISDIIGKTVFKQQVNANQRVNISHLPSGIYFVTVNNTQNVLLNFKFIKL